MVQYPQVDITPPWNGLKASAVRPQMPKFELRCELGAVTAFPNCSNAPDNLNSYTV